jgi:hypothetical protein
LATIFFITKERKHEKGNYWGLVEFGSDYGMGILYDSHHHVWWANRHLYNLLLWQQLHNKLFLITMFGNTASLEVMSQTKSEPPRLPIVSFQWRTAKEKPCPLGI